MRIFDADMVMLGMALGMYWLRTLTAMRSAFIAAALLAVAALLLTALLPEGWFRFFTSIAQAPTIGLTVAHAPALRYKS
ncbi:MAG: hypothetical protein DIU70_002805 [Bacillota bacterium]|nr:MAG: hypothetical protein DIU70_02920 [Bacillota bacterium]